MVLLIESCEISRETLLEKTMYLNFGINDKGEWQHISTVKSGQTELICPYCGRALLVRKGQVNAHHFAHKFDTCLESGEAVKAATLPTIDKFEMLNAKEQKYMDRRERYSSDKIYSFAGMYDAISNLEAMGLLKVEKSISKELSQCQNMLEGIDPTLLDDEYYPTDSLIAIGDALRDFINIDFKDIWLQQTRLTTSINECYHKHKLSKQHTIIEFLRSQAFWLQAHYDKQSRLNPEYTKLITKKVEALSTQHLYLFKFKAVIDENEETFLKIGMTSRTAEERLSEVTNDLNKHVEILKAEVLSYAKYAGRVEPLLHNYYAQNRFRLAKFKELFNTEIESKLIDQFEAIDDQEFSKPFKLRRNILNNFPNFKKETGRRPKSRKELIAEYPEVVELLKLNLSIREVARQTGRAKNTVQRVRSALLH